MSMDVARETITIIGGGLAGCEAAYQIAKRGGRAVLYEMKPRRFSPAHSSKNLSELVCSNSFKSDSLDNASGLLKEEMRLLDSLIIKAAVATRVPAGKSLAVDRNAFSLFVEDALSSAGVEVVREEVIDIPPSRPLIIATGPLTSDALAKSIQNLLGRSALYFYDALSPIVYKESIDFDKAFFASRYNKGTDDYINCPMDRQQYERFYNALIGAERVELRDFEKIRYFEGCMPIEVLADRGFKTPLFGPLKPVGLVDPRTGKRPYAVVQLRRENREDTLYNMVGFQTRLKFPEQKRVFRLIPGLERAEFARYGMIHRNTYMDSPRLLRATLQLRKEPAIFFAGQITGVEGYSESALSGLIAGINALRLSIGLEPVVPPAETMTGALLRYISDPETKSFQPMNANFGLLPKGSKERRVKRALEAIRSWRDEIVASSGTI